MPEKQYCKIKMNKSAKKKKENKLLLNFQVKLLFLVADQKYCPVEVPFLTVSLNPSEPLNTVASSSLPKGTIQNLQEGKIV